MDVKHIFTLSAYLDKLPIVDGQVIVLKDDDKMYYDMGGTRHPVKSVDENTLMTLATEQTVTGNKTFKGNVQIDTLTQGTGCTAAPRAHAEGNKSSASGDYSHAEGSGTTAQGNYSHAGGVGSYAMGVGSTATGFGTVASDDYSTAVGVGNAPTAGDLFEVGNGKMFDEKGDVLPTDSQIHRNAFRVTSEGRVIGQTDVETESGHKLSAKEDAANKVVAIGTNPTDTEYPSAKAVKDYIDAMPEPMVFKGTLGTGGTVTDIPIASPDNEGHTYKIITAGTYQSVACKVGDTLISNGSAWVIIPSGDEPVGTVTNVAAEGTGGVTVTGGPVTSSGKFTISGVAATQAVQGMMSASDKKKLDGIAAGANAYSLPTASATVKGGIKVGSNLSMTGDTLNAKDTTYTAATQSAPGLMSAADKVKLDGVATNANNYSLPTASATVKGGVKIGSNLSMNGEVLNAKDTTYVDATQTVSGLFSASDKKKLDGIATGANAYSLPMAGPNTLGGVKVGNNLSIDASGVLSSTDTNTWRPIQDNLTSSAADQSLSANQGRILNEGKAAKVHTHTKSEITDFPSSLPANGGNASTVNNHTVNSNVPANAKFTDTTYSTGTSTYSGTTKLYTGIGTATDGTMTQAALKTALDSKAASSHSHTNLDTLGRVAYIGSDAANTAGWYKVYSTSISEYSDHVARLSFVQGYSNINFGVLVLHLRCENSTAVAVRRLGWETRSGFDAGDAIIITGSNTWALYIKQNCNQYGRIKVRVLESTGSSRNWDIVLANNSTKETTTLTATATATDCATVNYANSAGNASKVNGHSVASDVPADAKFTDTTYPNATSSVHGLLSAADKAKLDGIAAGANKYTHPSYTARTNGLYKVTVDSSGHVSNVTAVAKADITALGIPSQDTTYPAASSSAAGLMSAADKAKLDGIGSGANNYSLPTASNTVKGGVKIGSNITVAADGTISAVQRGIQNNLTSDSTTDSLSAAQGRALKAAVDGKAAVSHTHTIANVTGLQTALDGKAAASHKHGNADITGIDASKITTGTISIDRLPQGALERLTVVADDAARFKLTSTSVQKGDTVKVTSTGKMYYVIDESKLSTEAGYEVYAAGTAASVPWSGVTGKPSSYTPSSHTHDDRYYTETEVDTKLKSKANTSHTHTKSQITDFPTSMPASDVYAWAKAATKPSYSKSEVGLGNVDNTADANKSVKHAASADSATTASAANKLNVTATITGGDGNTTGYRLLASISISMWSNYRSVFLVKSRHEGNGVLFVSIGNNTGTISQANGFAEIKYFGTTDIATDAFQVYFSADGKTAYLFEKFWDYSTLSMTLLTGDFTITNGTWMTSIPSATYGAVKAKTQINNATTVNGHTINSDVPAGAKFTDTNTTYSTGTATYSGTTKLYTGTGTATDGTMTQAAIKSALDGKQAAGSYAAASHKHSYNDLNDKPAIPTVGNGTVTITQNGTSKGSFTLNQSGDATIALTDNNTVYTHPTTSGNKHIPSGGSAGQILRWSADGTAVWGADNNTQYSDMKGATASAAGTHGLVPAPATGAANRYLRSDGTWQVPPDTNTTYPDATQSTHGLMNAADKKKLDGIASGATAVSDSTVSGWGYKKTDTNTWRPLGTTADTACAGNDSRLSNSRPASDVYAWAKASTKPTYSYSEISGAPSILSGTAAPTASQGKDGDIYIQLI